MSLKYSVLVLFAVFCVSESALVDDLKRNKCSINDGECQRKLYALAFQEYAKTGFPEYGIPPFDPFEIKNISVSVLGLVDIGMIDGVAKGVRNCQFTFVNTTLADFHSTMEVICDITIKGRYKVLSDNALTKNLLGGATVQGTGYGKVKLEKLRIVFDFNFSVKENDDEVYIDWDYSDSKFQYDYGKVSFAANNLNIGNLEVSQTIISILNDNWKSIMTSFGKPFTDTAMKIIDGYAHQFFDAVPTRMFLTEDMSIYLKE